MAKWTVEQRKFDAATGIWAGNGVWEVEAKTPEQALEYVFVEYLERAEDFKQFIPLATKELYGLVLTVDPHSWSVRPAGAGVPG
ncbi:MAG: hypothetical protein P8182_09310 [Deltaproteobacteria bacterium]